MIASHVLDSPALTSAGPHPRLSLGLAYYGEAPHNDINHPPIMGSLEIVSRVGGWPDALIGAGLAWLVWKG